MNAFSCPALMFLRLRLSLADFATAAVTGATSVTLTAPTTTLSSTTGSWTASDSLDLVGTGSASLCSPSGATVSIGSMNCNAGGGGITGEVQISLWALFSLLGVFSSFASRRAI